MEGNRTKADGSAKSRSLRHRGGNIDYFESPPDLVEAGSASNSQDLNKPSDGHTGMSQDFSDLNTSSQDNACASSSVTFEKAAAELSTTRTTRTTRSKKRAIEVSSSAAATTSAAAATTSAAAATTSAAATSTAVAAASPLPMVSIKSYGTVAVVKRPAPGKKNNIKLNALQNTFYAFPLDASVETKQAIAKKIEEVTDNFEFQKYEVEVYEFGLPFEVEEVCRITAGYGMTPKRHKIPKDTTGKRKRDNDSSSEEDDNENEDNDEDVVEIKEEPRKKKRASADI